MSRADLRDPMLHAAAEGMGPDHLRWLSYADEELHRLREAAALPTPTGYAAGRPQYPPPAPRRYLLTAQDWIDAQRPDGAVVDGRQIRLVEIDGRLRIQAYNTTSSSDGEGWGDLLICSSDPATQAFIDLADDLNERQEQNRG
jgi:hypothetical protein